MQLSEHALENIECTYKKLDNAYENQIINR